MSGPARTAGGRWIAGGSGNPGGRPNFRRALEAIGMTSDGLRKKCIEFAIATMDNPKARTLDRLRAMEWLAAQVGLRPQFGMPDGGDGAPTSRPIGDMSDAELDQIIAEGEEVEGLIAAGKVLDIAADGTLLGDGEELDADLDGGDDDDQGSQN